MYLFFKLLFTSLFFSRSLSSSVVAIHLEMRAIAYNLNSSLKCSFVFWIWVVCFNRIFFVAFFFTDCCYVLFDVTMGDKFWATNKKISFFFKIIIRGTFLTTKGACLRFFKNKKQIITGFVTQLVCCDCWTINKNMNDCHNAPSNKTKQNKMRWTKNEIIDKNIEKKLNAKDIDYLFLFFTIYFIYYLHINLRKYL